MTHDQHPFATLTPDTLLDAVASLGLYPDGHLLALNSFENRVFRIGLEDEQPCIAKFYRPQRWTDEAIVEEHAFTTELADEDIPAIAPLLINGSTLHHHAGFRFALFARQGGRAPEVEDLEVLNRIGALMGRIHAVGRRQAFRHRPEISLQTFGIQSRDALLQGDFIPGALRTQWQAVVNAALAGVAACFQAAGPVQPLRIHGDCHLGNILWTDAGPHFVDFDDARSGPAIQDLWMLLSGDAASMRLQLSEILDGYEQFCEFNRRELQLVEALRTLRLLHHSAWLAQRWEDPAFPPAFPWFGTPHYWDSRIIEMREQTALMQPG
jgi:Ser/Thr protein kinase RdoA (MazF antagonist)